MKHLTLGSFGSVAKSTSEKSTVSSNSSYEALDQEVYAATMLGLGLWRLRPIIRPTLSALVARLEGIVRQCCADDNLETDIVGDFEYLDTLDPTGEKDQTNPFFATNCPVPRRGGMGFPRLQVENRVYNSRVLRKIRFELLARQDGLQSFRLLILPRAQYDLPILYLTVESRNDEITFVAVDSSPVRWDKTLPVFYYNAVRKLQSYFSTARVRPHWGEEFFSSLSVVAEPINAEETAQLLQYICSLTRLHIEAARHIPYTDREGYPEIVAGHRRFCTNCFKNEKIHNLLSISFGREKADDYLNALETIGMPS